ncbi:MAG TPA: hypothetical protein VL688_07360 [Verrucomicrobiae bacterium]|jgi:hypothetical protein|nr:hypothetical protein [Verrucomicrobiae bacterium]
MKRILFYSFLGLLGLAILSGCSSFFEDYEYSPMGPSSTGQ